MLFAVFLFSASDAVHKCEVEEKQRGRERGPHLRGEWRERVYRRVVVNARCAGSADDVWVALSGIAVAAFTFTLWRSTERLWKSAEDERRASEIQRLADDESRRLDRAEVANSLAIASRNADAAEFLASQSADNAKRHLRAYVLVSSVAVNDFEVGDQVSAEITIKNFGQTPAYNLKQWAVMGFDYFPATLDIPANEKAEELGVSIIGPGGTTSHFGKLNRPMQKHEIAGLIEGKFAVYAAGTITYTDVFATVHTTKYLLFTGGPVGKRDRMAAYMTGNTAD
jgi:hypothetical protein